MKTHGVWGEACSAPCGFEQYGSGRRQDQKDVSSETTDHTAIPGYLRGLRHLRSPSGVKAGRKQGLAIKEKKSSSERRTV